MIECKTITFDDQETVDLAECCSSYTGKGSRVHTATMLWKSYSHLLNFLINLVSRLMFIIVDTHMSLPSHFACLTDVTSLYY